MTAPRIEPGGLEELGLVNWLLCRVLSRAAGVRDARLFSTLGRQRGLFRAWLRFAGRLMPGGTLSRHEAELVILRVAHLRQCAYEFDHHLRLGRRVGVGPEQVERLLAGPTDPGWSDRHRALLAAVDALVTTKNIGDPEWAALSSHYSEPQRIELCMLVGHYELLATTIATLRIDRDF
ncbi:carboxymuconolactone decarboxylase family protein [Nannocystis pusilla]|uniref:Carboxymuconolactone decarboxylase family protein n=1 Tax=Nannocystis pusilla TaxID=889268 RepID=A0ABS7TPA3_9BACT|nr:carboxymuconolactone decarboxylase family protein [Nannocystis pusilla]MBZ5709967.1 carboxymuconolactone decarboxylase family protein [Nannocystis pusilla]